MVKPICWDFRVITTNYEDVRKLRINTVPFVLVLAEGSEFAVTVAVLSLVFPSPLSVVSCFSSVLLLPARRLCPLHPLPSAHPAAAS